MLHWPKRRNGKSCDEISKWNCSKINCFPFAWLLNRRKEQECEIAQLKAENDMIRKQALPHRLGPKNIPIPQVPAKIGSLRNSNSTTSQEHDETLGGVAGNASTSASPMISSVTKVVQPTATVSSVPVSGPSKCTFYLPAVNKVNSYFFPISFRFSHWHCKIDTNWPESTAATTLPFDNKFKWCCTFPCI